MMCNRMRTCVEPRDRPRVVTVLSGRRPWAHLVLALLTWWISGCSRSPPAPSVPSPASAQSERAIAQLGARVFADAALSSDGSTSCAGCHDPKRTFTDGRPVALGVRRTPGTRNAPSLLDITDRTTFFWDGRETRLEHVVLQPFTNAAEMGQPGMANVVERMARTQAYRSAFASAFGDKSGIVTQGRIAIALATYLRTLPRGSSRFDAFLASGGRSGLSADEHAGLTLFEGKAACSQCHSVAGSRPMLTDQLFHHTGIGFDRIAGNIAPQLIKLDAIKARGQPLGAAVLTDPDVAELGRFLVTRQPVDLGAFRTPSLRNVSRTAPYMHDGSIPTLRAAIEREIYYRSLERGQPIELTVPEQRQLLAFLGALDDR
jgi:cytochrome c peroxidase